MTGGLLKVMLEANFLYHWEVTATRQRSWWAHVWERVGDHTTSHWNLLFETSFMYVFFFFSHCNTHGFILYLYVTDKETEARSLNDHSSGTELE